jgi:hypothetical protein
MKMEIINAPQDSPNAIEYIRGKYAHKKFRNLK